ncbi:RNA polymerase sigma factor [Zunongwangia pacifica]|uniref:Sigma-70 family RNA polymerase sigma factor n=1 Tax=Zunongwangia pacifica TaxID=2911062 RepID=A0A9X2CPJ0_9FLAO|nr:sigma-70 family RNA polymerase sigma factor [Zunongwangia pacifica]MCL6218208.1 sigma-70 family RNA polymerase sigma factor [Zunongwangia pacifica]
MKIKKPLPLPNSIPNTLKEDLDLFQQISEGKYAALELLFNKYYDALCRFGLSYHKNISIVEEKVSDVFILLWNKRKELNQIEKPKSYLYVIAKNSLKKPVRSHLSFSTESKQRPILFSPSTEDEIIDKEQKEINAKIIQSILKSIPKKSRQIFELSRIDGFKYREISEIMDISPRTAENHIAIAMKYISKGLKEFHKNNH